MKFSIKDFSSKCGEAADLVTFTEEILLTGNFIFVQYYW